MRIRSARVQNYRSIRDTGDFEVEPGKTILVGPNEAGKTVLLRALQQIRPPKGVKGFDPLRDYPRALYNELATGKVDPAKVTVVQAEFELEDDDRAAIPEACRDCTYVVGRYLNNGYWHTLGGSAPDFASYGSLKKDLLRLAKHIDAKMANGEDTKSEEAKPSEQLAAITAGWADDKQVRDKAAQDLAAWLDAALLMVDENNQLEQSRLDQLKAATSLARLRNETVQILHDRVPVFVLFNNYFRVRPMIHLGHFADRFAAGIMDEDQYDYGNGCLLRLLDFTASELSTLGEAAEPAQNDPRAMKAYRDQLDRRTYQLNAASIRLTKEINSVWHPDPDRAEADRLRIQADGQYLKVVVEDGLGVEIELDQRSEGFQWLVSFFVVFFAEAEEKYDNAILLLDEPGLSLHGLKQREFQQTVSRLAAANQTLYTTHSPFLVGPDELDLVRVVEMTDRDVGTKVQKASAASDPAALLPLQEALGYDLARSLFAQQRSLILEGLTDYWYVASVATLLRDAGTANLNPKIALVPAGSAGKIAYFATIIHAHDVKVAALLDSDTAGDRAADQDVLTRTLGNRRILRTKDYVKSGPAKSEIEDLLRETLVTVAQRDLAWDISAAATAHPRRPIARLFEDEISGFSRCKLGKAFLEWTRNHEASDLTAKERDQWSALIAAINAALR